MLNWIAKVLFIQKRSTEKDLRKVRVLFFLEAFFGLIVLIILFTLLKIFL
ncbi:hypothetical protein SAMN05660236_5606 [Ohtaekwangia koreensis]|uniref:Uncharacterized protein n=1 Tax=Ohtaekwangia koreensis TaxID=688867 RepID=A0A1T5MJV6_9BACT|nr:hypothetical protein SAMN05660236_5606 [Ohtaekwangia koreensis]